MPDPDPRACPPARPAAAHRTIAMLVLVLLVAPLEASAQDARADDAHPPAPQWDHALELGAEAGYVQLRWLPPENEDSVDWVYELQEGRRPEFSTGDRHYEGHHTSSFVSGLENGTFYFRVRVRHPDAGAAPEARKSDAWSAWSQTVRVEVVHHPRELALALMGLGALVFVATAAFLIAHRNDPLESDDGGER